MATEPKIVREYRKALAKDGITIEEWRHTGATHIRLTVKRGDTTAISTIGHSDKEVTKMKIGMVKIALNKAERK